MQSSSLLPASSVRSFRVRAPRPAPPLTLVVAIVLLMLGGLAGAVALDGTAQPWLDSLASGVRGALPWNRPSDADDAFTGPIAMPVRVPLDPVAADESTPIAVAEAPAAGVRRDSDGGALRSEGTVSSSVATDATGTSPTVGATTAPSATGSATSAPGAVPNAPTASSTGTPSLATAEPSAALSSTSTSASVAGVSAATVPSTASEPSAGGSATSSAVAPATSDGSATPVTAEAGSAAISTASSPADGQ